MTSRRSTEAPNSTSRPVEALFWSHNSYKSSDSTTCTKRLPKCIFFSSFLSSVVLTQHQSGLSYQHFPRWQTPLGQKARTRLRTNLETEMAMRDVTPGSADAAVEVSTDGEKERHSHRRRERQGLDEYPHGWRLGVILAALCISTYLGALDQVKPR